MIYVIYVPSPTSLLSFLRQWFTVNITYKIAKSVGKLY
jgi:hypothetical protein